MELIIERNGLSPIPTRSTTEPVADVVFVHGLMGHPRNTWSASDGQSTSEQPAGKPQKKSIFSKLRKPKTDAGHKETADPSKRGVFWPSDFLARDLESARIFTYGYNADVVTGLFQSSNSNNIYEHTMTMAVRLKRKLEHHNVPIVFVVHSLGGVIVKDAINNSDFLRDRTKLVIFFGTPHRGSATAGWGELAGTFTRYFLFLDTNAGLVGDLDLNSQTLDRIHRDFVRNSQASGIHIHSLQESRALAGSRTKIVENFSSRMDIGELETVESIDADHRNMAKFNKDTDEGYEAVRSVLESFVRQTIRETDPPPTNPAPPASAAQTDLRPSSRDQPRGLPTIFGQPGGDDESQVTRSTNTPSVDKPQPVKVQSLDKEDGENIRRFSSDYPAARSGIVDRFPGTCEWIVQHADFERWSKPGEVSTPLWISGHPGMGKTVMSKFLLEHFEQVPSNKTLYFFFSDRDSDKKTATSFLRAAIHQLIQHSVGLYHTHVKPKLAAFGSGLYDSFGMLWDVFFNMTQDPALGPTVCVIDALDECEANSRQHLISCIGKCFSPPFAPATSPRCSKAFKLLLTSRPYEEILANWSYFHIIHLRAELEDPLINGDIGLFIDSEVNRLAKLRGYSESLRYKVHRALVRDADGMFLWVALMIKVLEATPMSRIHEELASLPSGIDALYNRILAEVPKNLVSTVSAILKWVAFAFRPLSIDELGVACALDSSPYESIAAIPEEVRTGIRGDLGLCGPILKVKNNHVHLVHQTTKEYLVRRCATDTVIGALLPAPRDAHSQLALACMRLINTTEVAAIVAELESDSEPVIKSVPFTEYASSYWGSHVRETGTVHEADPLWLELSLALDSAARLRWLAATTNECRQNWSDLRFHQYRQYRPKSRRLSPVHILLDCACESASALYTRSGQHKASTKDSCERILLHMAVERGFYQVVINLLGTEPEAVNLHQKWMGTTTRPRDRRYESQRIEDSMACTPLHIAATRGDVGAIDILLRHGASVDEEETKKVVHWFEDYRSASVQRSRTALHCATTGNHLAAVRRLLDGSADIEVLETREKGYIHSIEGVTVITEEWTALHVAASLGFVAISHLLLQRGAVTVSESDGNEYAPYNVKTRVVSGAWVCGTNHTHEVKPKWPEGRVPVQGRLREVVQEVLAES